MRVVITGAGGNLGGKLISHLQHADWCDAIIGIDPKPLQNAGKLIAVSADLRDAHDERWIAPVREADAVVHFAAQNPAPDSDWTEAAQSSDMTLNLLAQLGHKPCRFIFASSNHVMGGYKDAPPITSKLGVTTPALPGTRYFNGVTFERPTAYGSSKLFGERAVTARAAATLLTAVNIRIGWVQPGENLASTINPNGGGTLLTATPPDAAELARATAWYRGMWLSTPDFHQLLERALTAPTPPWPTQSITVSGVSDNTGTAWDLEDGRKWLGYEPVEDVEIQCKTIDKPSNDKLPEL